MTYRATIAFLSMWVASAAADVQCSVSGNASIGPGGPYTNWGPAQHYAYTYDWFFNNNGTIVRGATLQWDVGMQTPRLIKLVVSGWSAPPYNALGPSGLNAFIDVTVSERRNFKIYGTMFSGAPAQITISGPGLSSPAQWPDGRLILTGTPSGELDVSGSFGPGTHRVYLWAACPPPGGTFDQTVTLEVLCKADFDQRDGVTVNDIFAFLNAWFAGNPAADQSDDGQLSLLDVFLFLNIWFNPCN